MAGIRQHHIPRFLQSGFRSHSVREAHFAWVFRRGSRPFNANITNIGVEGYFYDADGNTTVDDSITAAEGPWAGLVKALRGTEDGRTVEAEAASELIAHLSVRTRHLRQNMLTTGESLVRALLEAFSDPFILEAVFRRKIESDPSFLVEQLRESLAEMLIANGVPAEDVSAGVEAVMPQLIPKLPELMADTSGAVGAVSAVVRASLHTLPEKLRSVAKSAHLRVLSKALAPPAQVEALSRLNYRVVRAEAADLILGDSAVIYFVDSSRVVVPFYDKAAPLRAVLLPLSSDAYLLGTSPGVSHRISAELDLRKAIAACSLEYFIAGATGRQNEELAASIGSNSYLLSPAEMSAALAEWI